MTHNHSQRLERDYCLYFYTLLNLTPKVCKVFEVLLDLLLFLILKLLVITIIVLHILQNRIFARKREIITPK